MTRPTVTNTASASAEHHDPGRISPGMDVLYSLPQALKPAKVHHYRLEDFKMAIIEQSTFTKRNGALFDSKKQTWQTPRYVFDPLNNEFDFTVDAAASHENAMLSHYWTEEDDGLVQDWTGHRVWCNPPYNNYQVPFVMKGAECKADIAVFLLPVRTSTILWHTYIFPIASDIRFIKGGITFVGAKSSAPFPSAIVVFERGADPKIEQIGWQQTLFLK